MDRIQLSQVTKQFSKSNLRTLITHGGAFRRWHPSDLFLALDRVDLTVPSGIQRFGIIGSNGSGKTTLLRIIAGVTEPSSGRTAVNGRVVPLLELGAGMHPDLTGRENIYLNSIILGMRRQEVQRKFDSIVGFAEVEKFLDMPLKHYSLGMIMRIGFSVATHVDSEILLVDEAWGIGDASFQAKSFEQMRKMQERGVVTLLVSHDLEVVRKLASESVWLDSGRVASIGPTEQVIQAYLKHATQGRK